MFSAYQRHQVGVNSSITFLSWISGGEKSTWQWSEPLPTCSQAASFDALPLFKKSEDQKKLGQAHGAGSNLLLRTYFILMGSSQRQHLPTGNALLVNVSGQPLAFKSSRALCLYLHINLSVSPIHPEKKGCSSLSIEQGDCISCLSFCLLLLKQPTAWTG